MGNGSFPGVKRPGLGFDRRPSASVKVEERLELYLYFPSGLPWPVLGEIYLLPLPTELLYAATKVKPTVAFLTVRAVTLSVPDYSSSSPCSITDSNKALTPLGQSANSSIVEHGRISKTKGSNIPRKVVVVA
jgi:hypothetical protein